MRAAFASEAAELSPARVDDDHLGCLGDEGTGSCWRTRWDASFQDFSGGEDVVCLGWNSTSCRRPSAAADSASFGHMFLLQTPSAAANSVFNRLRFSVGPFFTQPYSVPRASTAAADRFLPSGAINSRQTCFSV